MCLQSFNGVSLFENLPKSRSKSIDAEKYKTALGDISNQSLWGMPAKHDDDGGNRCLWALLVFTHTKWNSTQWFPIGTMKRITLNATLLLLNTNTHSIAQFYKYRIWLFRYLSAIYECDGQLFSPTENCANTNLITRTMWEDEHESMLYTSNERAKQNCKRFEWVQWN